jgi:mono/diheme cytochrome c family protein
MSERTRLLNAERAAQMRVWRSWALALLLCSTAFVAPGGWAQSDAEPGATGEPAGAAGAAEQPADQGEPEEAAAEEGGDEGPAEFTEVYLADEAAHAAGQEVWEGVCRSCHGASAYPGKAPKLRPKRYTADFVFDRVTNGYRKMPAWKDVYTKEERMAVTAYILSRSFSP